MISSAVSTTLLGRLFRFHPTEVLEPWSIWEDGLVLTDHLAHVPGPGLGPGGGGGAASRGRPVRLRQRGARGVAELVRHHGAQPLGGVRTPPALVG